MALKLKVDMDELGAAFDNSDPYSMRYFLDTETGKVLLVMDETSRELEDYYQLLEGTGTEPHADAVKDLVRRSDLPDWRKQALLDAYEVEAGYGTRYIAVPAVESGEAYRDMERFITTVRDRALQDRLWRAISGRGAFRYFKDVLHDHPKERERWFAFSGDSSRERVLAWLADQGIEPIH